MGVRWGLYLGSAIALGLGQFGCFSPSLPSNLACGPSGDCPSGLSCDSTQNLCLPPDQIGGPDAGPDGGPIFVDADSDGIDDAVDNCLGLANADQADEDGDDVGTACDNCPGIANADQNDVGETSVELTADGVGDACDPHPNEEGDELVFFDPFDGTSLDPGWATEGNIASWEVSGGRLVQRTRNTTERLYRSSISTTEVTVQSRITLLESPTSEENQMVAVAVVEDDGGNLGTSCAKLRDGTGTPNGTVVVGDFVGTELSTPTPGLALTANRPYQASFLYEGGDGNLDCAFDDSTVVESSSATVAPRPAGNPGVMTVRIVAAFDYVAIYRQTFVAP